MDTGARTQLSSSSCEIFESLASLGIVTNAHDEVNCWFNPFHEYSALFLVLCECAKQSQSVFLPKILSQNYFSFDIRCSTHVSHKQLTFPKCIIALTAIYQGKFSRQLLATCIRWSRTRSITRFLQSSTSNAAAHHLTSDLFWDFLRWSRRVSDGWVGNFLPHFVKYRDSIFWNWMNAPNLPTTLLMIRFDCCRLKVCNLKLFWAQPKE